MNRLKLVRYVLWCSLLMLLMSPAEARHVRRFAGNKEAKPYTRDLPAIDKVELLKLDLSHSEMWNGKDVEAMKTIEGREARKIASLWRAQAYRSSSAICHEPSYAIKFYSKDKLIAYASVCWMCNNVAFVTPELRRTQGFNGKGIQGQRLLQVFQNAFPKTE
jgi:hypothetical protein